MTADVPSQLQLPRREALGARFPARQSESLWTTFWWLCLLAPSSGAAFPIPTDDSSRMGARRVSPKTLRRHVGRLARLDLLSVDWRARTLTFNAGPLDPLPGEGREESPPPETAWRWRFERPSEPSTCDWFAVASGPARWRRPCVVLKRSGERWMAAESDLAEAPLGGWTHEGHTREEAAALAAPPWHIPNHWDDNPEPSAP